MPRPRDKGYGPHLHQKVMMVVMEMMMVMMRDL